MLSALWQHLEIVFWSLVEYGVFSIEASDKCFFFLGSTETKSFQSLSGIFHCADKEYWLKYPLSKNLNFTVHLSCTEKKNHQ